MAIISSTHFQALIVLSAMTAAVPALAEERPAEPPAGTHDAPSAQATPPLRLAFDGISPGSEVRVVSKSEGAPATASCSQDCELKLQKGEYTVIAIRGEYQRTKEVDLSSSQVVKVGAWDGAVRTTGTVVGITGVVVGALGVLATVAMYMRRPDPPDSDPAPGHTAAGALPVVGMILGSVLAFGGFSLAASNRAPSMDLQRMPTTYPPPSTGAGISLGGKF